MAEDPYCAQIPITMKIMCLLALLWLIAFSSLFIPMLLSLFGPGAISCIGGVIAVLAAYGLYESRNSP